MHIATGVRSARHIVRVAQTDTSSSIQSTSSPSPVPLPVRLSTSIRPLIASFIVVGAICLAIVAWRIRSCWKYRKARTIPTRLSIVYNRREKPTLVSLVNARNLDRPRKATWQAYVPSSPLDWATQVRCVKLPPGVTVPPVAVTAPNRSPVYQEEYPPTPQSGPPMPPFPSLPPTYRVGIQNVTLPPTKSDTVATVIPPSTPLSRKNSELVSIPLCASLDSPPVPSPRSASFNTSTAVTPAPRTTLAAVFAPKALPRLMLVSTTFQPSRDDELAVRVGETLRLLKEFEDEWCLVQRVGRPNAEKGVVPRFCLVDIPGATKGRVLHSGLTSNGIRRK